MHSTGSGAAPDFRINNFDLIRLFAASQVMLFHCAAHLHLTVPFPLSLLSALPGVPIFFTTSGFLIAASYDRSNGLGDYVRKRLLRLVPALWVCIAVTFVILLCLGYRMESPPGLAWAAAQMAGLIYTPGFLRDFGFGSYNGSLWTIPIECQFYATVPILTEMLGNRRYPGKIMLAILALFVAVALWARWSFPSLLGLEGAEPTLVKLLRYSFVPHYFMFLMGYMAYRWRLWSHPAIQGRALVWIAAVVAFSLLAGGSALSSIVHACLLVGCTLACAYTSTRFHHMLAGNDISYGVYIYHGLLINLVLTAGLDHRWIGLVLVMLLAYPFGLISWRCVEKPLLRLKRVSVAEVASS